MSLISMSLVWIERGSNNSEVSKFDTAQRLDHSSEASKPETVEKLAQFGHKQVQCSWEIEMVNGSEASKSDAID
jgi:hypothetical protein